MYRPSFVPLVALAAVLISGTADAEHARGGADRPHPIAGVNDQTAKLESKEQMSIGEDLTNLSEVAALKSGATCAILGYHVSGQSKDAAMIGAAKYLRAIGTKHLFTVGTLDELEAAMKRCPEGSKVMISTHGFSALDGGFAMDHSEPAIYPGTAEFTRLARALRGRKKITLNCCLVGAQALEGREMQNFGNRLANETGASVVAYSKEVWVSSQKFTSQTPGTYKLTFVPDALPGPQTKPSSPKIVLIPPKKMIDVAEPGRLDGPQPKVIAEAPVITLPGFHFPSGRAPRNR